MCIKTAGKLVSGNISAAFSPSDLVRGFNVIQNLLLALFFFCVCFFLDKVCLNNTTLSLKTSVEKLTLLEQSLDSDKKTLLSLIANLFKLIPALLSGLQSETSPWWKRRCFPPNIISKNYEQMSHMWLPMCILDMLNFMSLFCFIKMIIPKENQLYHWR